MMNLQGNSDFELFFFSPKRQVLQVLRNKWDASKEGDFWKLDADRLLKLF